ncbi:MAG: hypothetical protein RL220_1938 [Bacteroidota bacterium]
MTRVLFIATHRPDRAPNQRFRFEQYLPYFAGHGIEAEVSYLLSAEEDRFFYAPGHHLRKARILMKHHRKRAMDLRRMDDFDVVFVVREALLTRSIWFEKSLKRHKAKFIYDFDDAIWLSDVSDANRRFSWMKNPAKTSKIISMADVVIAGNQYLGDYALEYNRNVHIIPTTIDTSIYSPVGKSGQNRKVVIGWSGSITTIKHFEFAIPFLRRIKAEFGDAVEFRVIGDANYRNDELGIIGLPWKKDSELDDLSEFDIGIMPLPDDEWAKGKCGLKGLQYMALGIPAIMSPVGVNSEIIQHGVNGFLPSTEQEWFEAISGLINNPLARREMGTAARATVEERYSTRRWLQRYVDLIKG